MKKFRVHKVRRLTKHEGRAHFPPPTTKVIGSLATCQVKRTQSVFTSLQNNDLATNAAENDDEETISSLSHQNQTKPYRV